MKARSFCNGLTIVLGVVAAIGLCFTPAVAKDDLDPSTGLPFVEEEVILPPEEAYDDFEPDAESFGLNYQYTWVPASDFTPYSDETYIFHNYYGYLTTGSGYVVANIRLPSGAYLYGARFVVYDNDASTMTMSLIRHTGYVSFATMCSVNTTGVSGYGAKDVNIDASYRTIANANNLYHVLVTFGAGNSNLKFMGVRLWWARQVRTGLSHPFTDLGDQTSYFRDCIAALYHSGITSGTSATTYSPNANLTRGQMAVFLARALGLYWSGPGGY